MAARVYRHEEIAAVPRGWRVRTLVRGAHRIRVAYPPGPRRKGTGKPISILHPRGENPSCRVNPVELVIMGTNPTPNPGYFSERFSGGSYVVVVWANDPAKGPFYVQPYVNYGDTSVSRLGKYKTLQTARKKAKAWLDAQVRRSSNPSAEGLFEEFHGAAPTGVTTYQEPHVDGTLTELGDLLELKVLRPRGYKWGSIDFTGSGVKLASNAKGTQIYLIGGDQSIPQGTLTYLGADNSKDLVDLGEALYIAYRTKKAIAGHISSGYEHDFGEDTGRRPQVSYDRLAKRILFSGGEYTIEAPGIIN